jgi:hypothetical protein
MLLCAIAVPVARAVDVGIGDQKAASFGDARLRGLGLRYARLIVPYDAVTSEPAVVDQWLAAVAADGMVPHVAFEHLRTDRCPGRPCTAPSVAAYATDVRAFIARWPQVRTYTTWNEANHESQPVASRPELVAAYYDQLVAACPGCTVVAGDVLDSGGYASWLRRFLAASDTTPRLWGLHDYGDVTYGTTTGVDTVLSIVPGTLWIEETGAIVTLRDGAGRTTFSTSESSAASAIDRAFAIAAARPRIGRMYVYEWQAFTGDAFDAGLVRPDGTARPALDALRRDLGPASATSSADATTSRPAVTWRAAWSKVHKRQLVITARCSTTVVRCTGYATATIRTRKAGVVTASYARVATRHAYRTTSSHRVVTLRITVKTAALARVRRASVRKVVLVVRATRPAAASSRVTLALARPR